MKKCRQCKVEMDIEKFCLSTFPFCKWCVMKAIYIHALRYNEKKEFFKFLVEQLKGE